MTRTLFEKGVKVTIALHLIERDLVVAAVVELRGSRALVRRHLLGVFEQAAVQQIDGDAGSRGSCGSRCG